MSENEDLWKTIESLLPEEWEMEGLSPFDFHLICPHGEPVDMDGWCPVGCTSPLRKMGLI